LYNAHTKTQGQYILSEIKRGNFSKK